MTPLVLDLGNTKSKLFAVREDPQSRCDNFVALGKWDTPRQREAVDSFLLEIQDVLGKHAPARLIVASVIPDISQRIMEFETPTLVLDHTHCDSLEFTVESPETVGMDRFCNVAGALDRGLTQALIADVGTATTFDIIQDSVFIGGLIAPGPKFSHDCLGHKGARLMKVDFEPQPLRVGINSREALARGGWNVGMGGIYWTIEGLFREYNLSDVLITGGLGGYLDHPSWKNDPQLTLKGALSLARRVSR